MQSNHSIQSRITYLKVVVDNGKQPGSYNVISEVTDKNAKESLALFSAFNADDKWSGIAMSFNLDALHQLLQR